MQRITKPLAMILVLACGTMTAPQKAEASLFGVIEGLVGGGTGGSTTSPTYPPPPPPPPQSYDKIAIHNAHYYRAVLIEIWDSNGGFHRFELAPRARIVLSSDSSQYMTFAIRASVYNNGRWVAKVYEVFDEGMEVTVWNVRRGVFRFASWYWD